MKIRGWIGVALCMVALETNAQDINITFASWQALTNKQAGWRLARTAGSQGSILMLFCAGDTCEWLISNHKPCGASPKNELVVNSRGENSANKRRVFEVECLGEDQNNRGYNYIVLNRKEFDKMVTQDSTGRFSSPQHNYEDFSFAGASAAISRMRSGEPTVSLPKIPPIPGAATTTSSGEKTYDYYINILTDGNPGSLQPQPTRPLTSREKLWEQNQSLTDFDALRQQQEEEWRQNAEKAKASSKH